MGRNALSLVPSQSPAVISRGIEHAMLQKPQVACPVVHHFSPGIYMREVMFPAGILAVGHSHKAPQLNLFLKGRVRLMQPDGSMKELQAPMRFMGEAGQKVFVILEETVWVNLWATDERDVEVLEGMFVEKSPESEFLKLQKRMAASSEMAEIRNEYYQMLRSLHMTPEDVLANMDQAPVAAFPDGSYKCKTGPSAIQGKGLFATADIVPGEVIAPMLIDGVRTLAGRFTNHSAKPNAKAQLTEGGGLCLVATSPITGCISGSDGEEILLSYPQVIQELQRSLSTTLKGD